MKRRSLTLRYSLLAALAVLPCAAEPPAARTDLYGDPLPPGAVARLGTVRLHKRWIGICFDAAFTPDGRLLATAADSALYLWDRETGKLVRTLNPEGIFLSHFAFTPDGKRVYCDGLVGEDRENALLCWDVASGLPLAPIRAPDHDVCALAVSPDGKLLAVGDSWGRVHLYDPVRRKRTCRIPPVEVGPGDKALPGRELKALAFSPDGRQLTALDGLQRVRLLEVATGKELHRFTIGDKGEVILAPGGRCVVSYTDEGLSLRDAAGGKARRLPTDSDTEYFSLTFSPDGQTLLGLGWRGDRILFWDVDSGRQIRRLPLRGLERWCCLDSPVLSPDGKTLAVPDGSDAVRLVDMAGGQVLCARPGHTSPPRELTFSPDGKALVSYAHGDGILRWDLTTKLPVRQIRTRPTFPRELPFRFGGGGRYAAVTESGPGLDPDETVVVYDTRTGERLREFRDREKLMNPLALSPDGKTLAAAEKGGGHRLWDVPSGKPLRALEGSGEKAEPAWLEFSPDGRTLVGGSRRDRVERWDARTGKLLGPLQADPETGADWSGVSNEAWRRCFSPDGGTLLASYMDGWLVVWDLAGGAKARRFRPEEDEGESHSLPAGQPLSPDGRLLVLHETLDEDDASESLSLWETASGQKVGRLKGDYNSVAFAPDCRTLATACKEDSSILLCDVGELTGGVPGRPSPGWDSLADFDAAGALRAVFRLAGDERAALALAGARLRPAPRRPPEELPALLKALDSPLFAEREKASARLGALGEAVAPDLKAAAAGGPPEVRRRAQILLERLAPDAADRLREVRAVQALEYLGTPAARDFLRRLAGGAPEVRLTREAGAALARLQAR